MGRVSSRECSEWELLESGTLVLALSPCMPPTDFPFLNDIHGMALCIRALWPGRVGGCLFQLLSLRGRSVRGTRTGLRNLIFVLEPSAQR